MSPAYLGIDVAHADEGTEQKTRRTISRGIRRSADHSERARWSTAKASCFMLNAEDD
jgi:hypothetical protein